jgi:acyl transferase domain-containing protein
MPGCIPSLPTTLPQDFDAAPFGLSPQEAAMADPQQRLLLEATAQLLAAAPAGSGYGGGGAFGRPSDVGVFVGAPPPLRLAAALAAAACAQGSPPTRGQRPRLPQSAQHLATVKDP